MSHNYMSLRDKYEDDEGHIDTVIEPDYEVETCDDCGAGVPVGCLHKLDIHVCDKCLPAYVNSIIEEKDWRAVERWNAYVEKLKASPAWAWMKGMGLAPIEKKDAA